MTLQLQKINILLNDYSMTHIPTSSYSNNLTVLKIFANINELRIVEAILFPEK